MNVSDVELVKKLARIEIERAFTANIKVWKFKEDSGVTYSEAILPEKKHPGDSGYDLYTCFDDVTIADAKAHGKKEPDPIVLYPGQTLLIPTGICQEIPEGFELQVRPRSGCSKDGCVAILGTVDESFSKHLRVIACNTGNEPYEIHHHDRLAQVVVAKVCPSTITWGEGEGPRDKNRGEGFGSSGK